MEQKVITGRRETRGRKPYPKVTMDRCVEIYRKDGMQEAVRRSGISRRTIYYYMEKKRKEQEQ